MSDVIGRVADNDEHIRRFLSLYPFRVFLCENNMLLLSFKQFKRIRERNPIKGSICPSALEELMLNVQTGDVVGQEHHLVAMQLMAVFLFQRRTSNVLHQSDDEVARADERINNMNTGIRQRSIELAFKDLFNAVHHEIDDRLWRVDDAVCVRYLHREALKELLVDGVEEVLFLREVLAERGSVLDSSIERVQRFEKLVATKGVLDEYLNNVFDLACDDISAREVRVVEDGTEDPFRQQMLDEHLLNGSRGEVWVDCGTALLVEIREGGDKLRVRRVLLRL